MRVRWISAAVGIPLFVSVCIWGALPFAIGMFIVAFLGLCEMVRTYHSQGIHPNLLLAATGLLAPALCITPSQPVHALFELGAVGAVLVAIAAEVFTAAKTGEMKVAQNTAFGLLCALYTALFAGLPALRETPGITQGVAFPNLDKGLALVLVTAFCVWGTDTFALFVGRVAGRRKLAPLLSPSKTVEGALGGVAGGLLFGAVFGQWLLGNAGYGLAIGAVAGFIGQIGDLFESALKREAGVKDFGILVPGHGGVLDRFDSVLVVAPIVCLGVWLRW